MFRRLPSEDTAISLARAALARREDLAGAGRAIMLAYGLDEKTARDLHAAEVARRKREARR